MMGNFITNLSVIVLVKEDSVATRLRCGGIFKHEFVANLLLSPSVKKALKSVNIW